MGCHFYDYFLIFSFFFFFIVNAGFYYAKNTESTKRLFRTCSSFFSFFSIFSLFFLFFSFFFPFFLLIPFFFNPFFFSGVSLLLEIQLKNGADKEQTTLNRVSLLPLSLLSSSHFFPSLTLTSTSTPPPPPPPPPKHRLLLFSMPKTKFDLFILLMVFILSPPFLFISLYIPHLPSFPFTFPLFFFFFKVVIPLYMTPNKSLSAFYQQQNFLNGKN